MTPKSRNTRQMRAPEGYNKQTSREWESRWTTHGPPPPSRYKYTTLERPWGENMLLTLLLLAGAAQGLNWERTKYVYAFVCLYFYISPFE
jgi:hypothetical protein